MNQDYKYILALDIETFSSVNLKKCGLYKYASSPDFEILIVAFKIDDEPTRLLDLKSPPQVESFLRMLQNPAYRKTAFNAPFERICLMLYYNIYLDPAQWECTMAKAYQCGMNGGLDQISKILRVGEKMKEGYQLMRFFTVPCRPTKVNGGRTRNLPKHDPEKFYKFQLYCIKDVDLETLIRKKLFSFEIPEFERKLWILDQQINDRGILVDNKYVNNAIKIDSENLAEVYERAIEITGISNPKSTKQLKLWIEQELDEEIDGIGKDKLPAILKKSTSKALDELIDLRKKMAKTSTAKYQKMLDMAVDNNRVYHLFQFCGASRTGRWAGRGIQLHNLPKNDMWGLDDVETLTKTRQLILEGDKQYLNILHEKPASILSQLIRTAFIPSPGNRFIVSDLSAIEARLTAWLAGEQWRLEVFKTHGKIYEASASAMFNIPIESITKTSDIRYAGKVAELSLGYGGSIGAIRKMLIAEKTKALEQGKIFSYNPTDAELKILVDRWRLANPAIVRMWYETQYACFNAVENPGEFITFDLYDTSIYFHVRNNVLFIELPSGRSLCYLRPRIIEGKKGYGPVISYEGKDDKSKWGRIETWGGKLIENIIQAIARDILAEKMLRLTELGYKIVAHVHDEIVIDQTDSGDWAIIQHMENINTVMGTKINWCESLPLAAETFETTFYRK